jgi:8-amino-7-oxononanoate synthase
MYLLLNKQQLKFSGENMAHRNTPFLVTQSLIHYQEAIAANLMQVTIKGRKDKHVIMPNGMKVVEFINCSYLGLDLHPQIINASKTLDTEWGVNFCCARSRFSIEPTQMLEEELSILFGGRAITFPSVTTAHLSVLPLLASGVLINPTTPPKVRIVFDKLAHASMQYLKPILATEATITMIPHNNLESLRKQINEAKANNEVVVYVADGIYSMGGLCPIKELLSLSQELEFYLYIDDAHGTSIFGDHGEGFILSNITGDFPSNLFITFCLSKGFGCNGGGILLPSKQQEMLVRSYGQIYAFSAALDFSIVNACLAAIPLHRDGTVKNLQQKLRQNVAFFDELMNFELPFSPIRMVMVGDEQHAIKLGEVLLKAGFFVSVVFFPIVPRNKAQLRICIAANHTFEQIKDLVRALTQLKLNKVIVLPT